MSTMGSAPTYSGYLHKRGQVGIKTYKKRFFMLINHEIQYFKEERDYQSQKPALGRIPLATAVCLDGRDSRGSTEDSSKAHFRIEVPGRVYYLFADTPVTVETWLRMIKSSKEHFSGMLTEPPAVTAAPGSRIIQSDNLSAAPIEASGNNELERPRPATTTNTFKPATPPEQNAPPTATTTVKEKERGKFTLRNAISPTRERPQAKTVHIKSNRAPHTITSIDTTSVGPGGSVSLADMQLLSSAINNLQLDLSQTKQQLTNRIAALESKVRSLEHELQEKDRKIRKLKAKINCDDDIPLQVSATRQRSISLSSELAPSSGFFNTRLTMARPFFEKRFMKHEQTKTVITSESKAKLDPDLLNEINKFQLEDYAKEFFHTNSQRKFQFRRKRTDLHALLSFSKDEFAAPLLKLSPTLVPQAVIVFRAILTYMGDLGSNAESPQLIQQIIEKAVVFPELRDEIYCQLCKQTCNNPSKQSYYRGWDIIVVCVCHFSSTKNLEPFLLNYFAEHIKLQGKDAKYASYCIEKITRLPTTRVPTIPEIEREKQYPFAPSVFGSSIELALLAQQTLFPDYKVPYLVHVLLHAIVKTGGCEAEGIFRLSSEVAETYKMRHFLDCGNYDLSLWTDPHVPANVFKLWLRELPEPLIPFDHYKDCVKAGQEFKSGDQEKLVEIFFSIPKPNLEVAMFIITFLQMLAKHQAKTKMGINNLAIIFAPSFLHSLELDLDSLQNSHNEIVYLTELFKYVDPKKYYNGKPPF